jgi:hypothetical protein
MRRVLWFFAGLSLLSTVGCAICASPHDCKYAAYGGLRERTDHVNGRVASVIDPASEINRAAWSGQSGHHAHPLPAEAGAAHPGVHAGEIPETPEAKAPDTSLPDAPPSIVPEEVQPPRAPGSVAPPMELPEGPQPSDGQVLPELPGEDTIELPDAGQTTRRESQSTPYAMPLVVPASVDLSPEAGMMPWGQTLGQQPSAGDASSVARAYPTNAGADPAFTADGRPLRSILKKPAR